MKVALRLGASGLTGAAVIVLFGLVLLPWLGGPALFGADFGEVCRTLMAEHTRGEALETRTEATVRCLEGKGEVTRELIAGRLTLAEAADRFERLSDQLDDARDDVPGAHRAAANNRSAMYGHVIRWVEVALASRPRQSAEVLARLEREQARLEAGAVR
jgi:hypothetical protein